jgi:hypothetical protein
MPSPSGAHDMESLIAPNNAIDTVNSCAFPRICGLRSPLQSLEGPRAPGLDSGRVQTFPSLLHLCITFHYPCSGLLNNIHGPQRRNARVRLTAVPVPVRTCSSPTAAGHPCPGRRPGPPDPGSASDWQGTTQAGQWLRSEPRSPTKAVTNSQAALREYAVPVKSVSPCRHIPPHAATSCMWRTCHTLHVACTP